MSFPYMRPNRRFVPCSCLTFGDDSYWVPLQHNSMKPHIFSKLDSLDRRINRRHMYVLEAWCPHEETNIIAYHNPRTWWLQIPIKPIIKINFYPCIFRRAPLRIILQPLSLRRINHQTQLLFIANHKRTKVKYCLTLFFMYQFVMRKP